MALRFRTLDFRTIDGSNNNLADPTLNQAGTDFARVGPAHFADGFNEMTPGPNPREISNIVVAQEDAGEEGPHLMDDNGVALSGRCMRGASSSITIWICKSQTQPRISRSQSR